MVNPIHRKSTVRWPLSGRLPVLYGSLLLLALASANACGKKKDKGGGGGPGPMGQQDPNKSMQPGAMQADAVKADFSGAVGALVLDPSVGGMGLMEGGGSGNGEDSFVKIQDDGEIAPILTVDKAENQNYGPNNGLPKIKTIAVSPIKEVFLHFEYPFIYRSQTEPQYLPKPGCEAYQGGEGNPPPSRSYALGMHGIRRGESQLARSLEDGKRFPMPDL